MGITMPIGGWAVGALRKALEFYPQSAPVRVFCAFDNEGPNSWENPVLEMDNGILKVSP